MENILEYFAVGIIAWSLWALVWKPRKQLEILEREVANIDEFLEGRLRKHIELYHNRLEELDTRFTSVERFLYYSGISPSKIQKEAEKQSN